MYNFVVNFQIQSPYTTIDVSEKANTCLHFWSNHFANLVFIIDHQIATINCCSNLIGNSRSWIRCFRSWHGIGFYDRWMIGWMADDRVFKANFRHGLHSRDEHYDRHGSHLLLHGCLPPTWVRRCILLFSYSFLTVFIYPFLYWYYTVLSEMNELESLWEDLQVQSGKMP